MTDKKLDCFGGAMFWSHCGGCVDRLECGKVAGETRAALYPPPGESVGKKCFGNWVHEDSTCTRCAQERECSEVGGWIDWAGGLRPVPGDVEVECKLNNGNLFGPIIADAVMWKKTGAPGDVVRYRVVGPVFRTPRALTESDPTGRGQHEPGAKLDAGKNRLGLVLMGFSRALHAVGQVGTYGAQKYTPNGWQEVPDGEARYTDALFRHLAAEGAGEGCDRDTGLLHAAHAAWNALARLDLMLRRLEGSDRG